MAQNSVYRIYSGNQTNVITEELDSLFYQFKVFLQDKNQRMEDDGMFDLFFKQKNYCLNLPAENVTVKLLLEVQTLQNDPYLPNILANNYVDLGDFMGSFFEQLEMPLWQGKLYTKILIYTTGVFDILINAPQIREISRRLFLKSDPFTRQFQTPFKVMSSWRSKKLYRKNTLLNTELFHVYLKRHLALTEENELITFNPLDFKQFVGSCKNFKVGVLS